MSATVLDCLRTLAGPDIFVGMSPVDSEDGLIDPEPQAIARAIPTRRAEFAAGRRAARMALADMGHVGTAIPQGEHRAPIWPDGIVGSLSHDDGLAIACVGKTNGLSGLGLDLADATDFPVHLRKEILRTPDEEQQTGLEARLNFSAKESVFKAFYPSVGAYFGFGAVEVTPDMGAARFAVRLRQSLGPVPKRTIFEGRFAIAEGRLMTLLALPA
ncbi:MAG: 4'-phosphopantetheinyl transferase superfamily protein [Pseudomonadota bacterium]